MSNIIALANYYPALTKRSERLYNNYAVTVRGLTLELHFTT